MNLLMEGEQTDRLYFRLVQESDFNNWLPFFQHPETSLHWIEPKSTPEIECQQWIQKQLHRYQNDLGGMNALFNKRTNAFVGYCGLLIQTVDQNTEVEIAYSLLPTFWNQGLASEAALKCRDFAFENKLSDSLISIISVNNKPSERVAIKNGMQLSKTTVYKENHVNIFRVHIDQWRLLKL